MPARKGHILARVRGRVCVCVRASVCVDGGWGGVYMRACVRVLGGMYIHGEGVFMCARVGVCAWASACA